MRSSSCTPSRSSSCAKLVAISPQAPVNSRRSAREKVVNGDPSWTLPMPARFVIGQGGVIAYREVNPDYTRRPDPEELLPVLKQLASVAA